MNLDGERKHMNTGNKVTWVSDRDADRLCGEKICVTKTQIAFKLSKTSCEWKQNGLFWFLYVNSKKGIRDNINKVQTKLQAQQRMMPTLPSIFKTNGGLGSSEPIVGRLSLGE